MVERVDIMLRILRRIFGRQRTELTLFQASIAANILVTSNCRTLSGPDRDFDLAA